MLKTLSNADRLLSLSTLDQVENEIGEIGAEANREDTGDGKHSEEA